MAWKISAEELLTRYSAGERYFAGIELVEREISLEAVTLRDINLRGAYFERVSFVRADLTNSDLGGIFLLECRLDEAIMQGVNLTAACVESSSFVRADLQRTQLMNINASHTSFHEAIIGGYFEDAILFDTSFYQAKFVIDNRYCCIDGTYIWSDGNLIDGVTLPDGSFLSYGSLS